MFNRFEQDNNGSLLLTRKYYSPKILQGYFGVVDYRVYMAVILVPITLLVSIRNLKYLSPVSMMANILQFTGLAITFYYLFQQTPDFSDRKYVATWAQLPLYFGTAIYAFEVVRIKKEDILQDEDAFF